MLSFISPGAHSYSSRGHSLTEGRICAGNWKRKESLGCLRRTCSPHINKIQAAAAAPLVQAIPVHLHLLEATHQPCNILHINYGEPELCPEAEQTRAPSPALCCQDASAARPSCSSTAGPGASPHLASQAPGAAQLLPLPRGLSAVPALLLSPVLTPPLLTVLGSCLIFDVGLSQAVFYLDTASGSSDLQFLLAAHADTHSLLQG